MAGFRKSKKEKRRLAGKKVKKDEHHVYCCSRKKHGELGKFTFLLESLVLRWPIKKHSAWHQIFSNLFAEEVLSLIKEAFKNGIKTPAGIISFVKYFLNRDRTIIETTKENLAAWRDVFNDYSSRRKIRKIIIKEWMYPGVRTIISGKGKIIKVFIYPKELPKKSRIFYNISRLLKNHPEFQIIERKNGQLLEII